MRFLFAIISILAISAVFANCTRRQPQLVPSSALGPLPGQVGQGPIEQAKPEVKSSVESPIPLDVPSDAPPPPVPQPPDDAGVDGPGSVLQPPPDTEVP
jgi:hypothetical protein